MSQGPSDREESRWDSFAGVWTAIGRAPLWLRHRRALVADLPPRSRVLEVCCGGGQLVVDLLRAGHDAWGEDISPAMVDHARAALGAAGLDAQRVRLGDVTAIDHPDRSFDAVVCTGSLGLLSPEDQSRALVEMRRVARRDVLLLEAWERWTGLYAGRALGWCFDGQRPISPRLARRAGLQVVEVRPVLGGAFSRVRAHVADRPLDDPPAGSDASPLVRALGSGVAAVTIGFGAWHLFVPGWFHWFDYVVDEATELVLAIRAINTLFSLSLPLIGAMQLAFLWRRPMDRFSVGVALAASTVLWWARIGLQLAFPQGTQLVGVSETMLVTFVAVGGASTLALGLHLRGSRST